MNSTRKGLAAGARSAVEPRITYQGRATREAAEYISDLQIGYSKPGSYSFPIFAPLGVFEENPEDDPQEQTHQPETFQRKATLQFMRGTRTAAETAASVETSGRIQEFDPTYMTGVSANLCDAMSGMLVDGYFKAIEIGARLSHKVESRQPGLARFEVKSTSILQEAAHRFRTMNDEPDSRSVTGKVTDLHRGSDESDGVVTVETIERGRRRNIYLMLDASQYHAAIVAHDAKKPVSASGTVEVRSGRIWITTTKHFSQIAELGLSS